MLVAWVHLVHDVKSGSGTLHVMYQVSGAKCSLASHYLRVQKSRKRCANPSYQNRLVKALDFGGVFRYTYSCEKVTPVDVSLRVHPLIS